MNTQRKYVKVMNKDHGELVGEILSASARKEYYMVEVKMPGGGRILTELHVDQMFPMADTRLKEIAIIKNYDGNAKTSWDTCEWQPYRHFVALPQNQLPMIATKLRNLQKRGVK